MADTIQQVYGYHGTSVDAATAILRDGFRMSRNEYDWLGDGVYFFQDAPERAWEWATTHHGSVSAVICALIRLEDGMDLLDVGWNQALAGAYSAFTAQLKRVNQPLPIQKPGVHRLDRSVINYAVGNMAEDGIKIRVVRAAFSEGAPVFPGSAIFNRSHVQIAVRDTALIENSWLLERDA
jgi:hypothetical protein